MSKNNLVNVDVNPITGFNDKEKFNSSYCVVTQFSPKTENLRKSMRNISNYLKA